MKLRVYADSAFALTLPDATTNPKVSTIDPLRRPDFIIPCFLVPGGPLDGGDASPNCEIAWGAVVKGSIKSILGGGFKYVFSSLFGEMIDFD